ncbi:MAG: class IV adenylate cyclase [Candidatus Bipolaricaulota bacterium]
MPRNVEIKARVRDLASVRERAQRLAGAPGGVLIQEDTFYRSADGRLKLRVSPDGKGELIAYRRPDAAGPKTSQYAIYRTPDPANLGAVLAAALGVRGVIRKRRILFLVGATRIHLDEVEGLGAFVELEVVLAEGQSEAEGAAIARRLIEDLGVRDEDLVAAAYIDLLEESKA